MEMFPSLDGSIRTLPWAGYDGPTEQPTDMATYRSGARGTLIATHEPASRQAPPGRHFHGLGVMRQLDCGGVPRGALTPTEVVTAWDAGADIVKIFPFGNAGGELVDAKTIKEGRFEIIEERTKEYLAVIAKARAEM